MRRQGDERRNKTLVVFSECTQSPVAVSIIERDGRIDIMPDHETREERRDRRIIRKSQILLFAHFLSL